MRVIIITNNAPNKINDLIDIKDTDYVIAVDGALKEALKQKINIDLAIGDFDSLENKNLLKGLKKIKLPKEKDETDTLAAIKYANEKNPKSIYILGGIQGDRIEHFYANIINIFNHENITMIDNKTQIYTIENKSQLINKNGYVNIFGFPKANITLKGFKYPLKNYNLNFNNPIGISNEVIKLHGEVIVNEGRVLVIETTE